MLAATLLSWHLGFGQANVAPRSSHECHLQAYGAIGDGKTLNSTAIKAAIADCHSQGGGTVIVDPGTYRTGTIELLDNTTLMLSAGATLLGSDNLADYPRMAKPSEERDTALIVAEHAATVVRLSISVRTCGSRSLTLRKPGRARLSKTST
jgi:hypothetical protein